MAGPEKALENKIKKYLKSKGAYFIKTLGGTPGTPNGTPDILACVAGKFVAFEVKRPDDKGRVSKLQIHHILKIRSAGGEAHVVQSLEEVEDLIGRII
jgi:Holliday junction resolvase